MTSSILFGHQCSFAKQGLLLIIPCQEHHNGFIFPQFSLLLTTSSA